jgi:hypothetical protein
MKILNSDKWEYLGSEKHFYCFFPNNYVLKGKDNEQGRYSYRNSYIHIFRDNMSKPDDPVLLACTSCKYRVRDRSGDTYKEYVLTSDRPLRVEKDVFVRGMFDVE